MILYTRIHSLHSELAITLINCLQSVYASLAPTHGDLCNMKWVILNLLRYFNYICRPVEQTERNKNERFFRLVVGCSLDPCLVMKSRFQFQLYEIQVDTYIDVCRWMCWVENNGINLLGRLYEKIPCFYFIIYRGDLASHARIMTKGIFGFFFRFFLILSRYFIYAFESPFCRLKSILNALWIFKLFCMGNTNRENLQKVMRKNFEKAM